MKNIVFAFFMAFSISLLMGHADARENMLGMRASFSDTVKSSSAAVVNFYTEKEVVTRTVNPLFDDPFFNQFFQGGLSGRMK
ncbi:MAG: hypothetical protein VXY83_03175, partial [Pseudomonadota bacterium]|nr:hypothetical protein [Pseudomonadota bacterium]